MDSAESSREPFYPQELSNLEAGLCGRSSLGQGGAVPYLLKQPRRVGRCEEVDGEDHNKDAEIIPVVVFLTLSLIASIGTPASRDDIGG